MSVPRPKPLAASLFPTAPPLLALLALGVFAAPSGAQEQTTYKTPPPEVVEILDAPEAPYVSPSPDRQWLVLAQRKSMPSIADMAQPMLRIGGRRINPATNGRFSPSLITGFSVMQVASGEERGVETPYQTGWGFPSVSPDGERFFVTRDTDDGIELWIGEVEAATLRRVLGPELNEARGGACSWMPGSQQLLCHTVVAGRGEPPPEPAVPTGPIVQENTGKVATVRTYQDLLEDPHDVDLYDYYMTSQPVLVDAASGAKSPLGGPAVYAGLSPSPSGEYFLVERRIKPYSYLVTDRSFPQEVEVWDREGEVVAHVASIPLGEDVPIGGVIDGDRNHAWMNGEPNTIVFVRALDGGDPDAEVPHRDALMRLGEPFDGDATELLRTEFRYAGMQRTADGVAFVTEYDRPTRQRRTWLLELDDDGVAGEPELLWDLNSEDRYADPGRPVMEPDERGDYLVVRDGDWVFLEGSGASDEGDRPFLDRMNLETHATERLWRSPPDAYETMVAMLDREGERLLIRRESKVEPPNYWVLEVGDDDRRALTDFPDPHPQLSGVTKEFVTYERNDGVQLSAELYLPPGYTEGETVPAVVWAYPREYSNAAVASQVRGSPNRFTRFGGYSHMFFLTQGYAVLDGAGMPIVGGDTANNTFIDQLVASGQAAVDFLVDRGISERDRIGIGGHSYGAFMTANLLAHSDLFAAGIARSGAYNRTLTPFGFQNERRTFWEAPEIYFAMSPFMHAEEVNEPILLIHGMADNNSGTFPIQSERFYHALKGHGATVRYVQLPYESHGYRARESVMDVLAEMIEWFDRYVKPGRRITEDGAGS
ncbi:MAG: prolyl oligopeptidase family serine peptidase [Gemmatimonadota bacterium]|jgi:dipeptidyl aminopeptidase/acylaminoacyl peptidase